MPYLKENLKITPKSILFLKNFSFILLGGGIPPDQ